ncbi:MAG: MarR family transcriptional regulator [Acutalibacteraceae bacterium]|nr:MarR family transcriptional regulator [Clostridia bacterium]MEE3450325.1 MarR family transcriptional regulator [Acutalibacteraceae bacterium]
MDEKYEALRLKNQLCFPLYAVSNLITRKYKTLLDDIDLTYTQYIVMMVLWEKAPVNEKFLCEELYLKSNTITPLLKKLENKNLIEKKKSAKDERNLVIELTEKGRILQDKALCVPKTIAKEICLSEDEAVFLYQILYKILDQERKKNNEKI